MRIKWAEDDGRPEDAGKLFPCFCLPGGGETILDAALVRMVKASAPEAADWIMERHADSLTAAALEAGERLEFPAEAP